MAKRPKNHQPANSSGETSKSATAHPPAKNPSLLAASIVLFVLWFIFLLVAAVWG
jgi:hypothetical protein